MSLTIRLHETYSLPEYTVPVGQAVRLPVTGMTERAMGCEVAQSEIMFDDPGAGFTLADLAGFRYLRLEESAGTNKSAFMGNFLDRAWTRGDAEHSSLATGTDRQVTIRVADVNWQMYRRVIHGSDGNRPAETDVERITWLIGSAYTFNVQDVGLIDTTNPVDMDPVDYRGRFAIDVVNDCMKVSGKNAFVVANQTGGGLDDSSWIAGFAYFVATDAVFESSIQLSNDPADSPWMPEGGVFADVVAVDPAVNLTSDPTRLFTGGSIRYTGGFVYDLNPTTQATYGTRDFSVDEPDIKTADAANALLAKYLDVSSFEEDIIVANVVLPAAEANNILAGHRIQVKLIHLPGYEDFVWRRIAQRSISQWNNRRDLYQLTLELRDPRLIGGIGTGAIPVPAGTTNGTLPYQPGTTHWYAGTIDGVNGGPFACDINFADFTPGTYNWWARITSDAGGCFGNIYLASGYYTTVEPPRIWGPPQFNPSGGSPEYSGSFTIDGSHVGEGHMYFSMGRNDGQTYTVEFWIDPDGWDTSTTAPVTGQPVLNETPTPDPDGSTTTFSTAFPFYPGSLVVKVDGLAQTGSVTSSDPAAGTFTLGWAPHTGSTIMVDYQAA